MNLVGTSAAKILRAAILLSIAMFAEKLFSQPAATNGLNSPIRIVELQGSVEVSPAGATAWILTQTNQILGSSDRLRTGANSRVAIRWSDQSIVSLGALTELEILPPTSTSSQAGLHLARGILSFFHRDKPGRIRVVTRGAVAGVEGTEFVLSVAQTSGTELSTLSVIDGKVRFENEQAMLLLTNGQQAVAELNKGPMRTAGFIANNILQWCFYYPAVLDLDDLQLPPEAQNALSQSIDAYRQGDLLAALGRYPTGRQPASDPERLYFAAILLSVGQVEQTLPLLADLQNRATSEQIQRSAGALQMLIAAVKQQPFPSTPDMKALATQLMAASYYEQSQTEHSIGLERALALARQAASNSPQFGFAWERIAELEFSFGRIGKSVEALNRSLQIAPRNAQALALKGFLLTAENKTREGLNWFEQALAIDPALGNAWLGRGLSRIRLGDLTGGREDLLVAAALEPQRAVLRSYLAKAYDFVGDTPRAFKELQISKQLDPHDPTSWLYSALLNQEHNRINQGIRDLERSAALNNNRSLYRSQLLLDEDRAVRSVNLAGIYQDAGMNEVAGREAARAVNYDYANYSAHLFLANSYLALTDPNLINLRYETPAENEYLLANLLAPVSAGPLSPAISQQEYSRLFQRDTLGVVSSTEYLSRGAWIQSGGQYGTFEKFYYDVEAFYRSDPGQRRNNDVEQRQLSLTVKQEITSQDTLYLQVKQYEAEAGDLTQFYDPTWFNPARIKETQEPILNFGYHHEWNPGIHTLCLFTRLDDRFSFTNQAEPTIVAFRPDIDPVTMPGVTTLTGVQGITMHERFVGNLEIYSGELQQIWQQPTHNTVIGTRFQYGHFNTSNLQNLPSIGAVFPNPPEPAAKQDITSLFKRLSFYGYHQWEIYDSLELIGGLTYDQLTFPENFRTAPISENETKTDEVSPKAGLIWRPFANTVGRFAYSRSLSGASLEQSYQLEPSQMAGFVQNFRSIIPESVAGANVAARFETFGLSLEQKFSSGTYLGVSGELLNSEVDRTLGAFDAFTDQFDFAVPSGLRENLDYDERSLLCTINQLVSDEWSFGARYRISQAVLKDNFVDVPNDLDPGRLANFRPSQRLEGVLQHLGLFAIYNHASGIFSQIESLWYSQDNRGYRSTEPGDEFWQLNTFAGFRFPRRKAEVMIGLLNATDQNYRLNPLNIYNELPRARTLAVRVRFNF